MKIICWNCRGLGNPQTIRVPKDLIKSICLDVVILLETRLHNGDFEWVRRKTSFDNGLGIDSNGRSGGPGIL